MNAQDLIRQTCDSNNEFKSNLRKKITSPLPPQAIEAANELKQRFHPRASAIVVYGSCLSQLTQSKNSSPDFFILPSTNKFFTKKLDRFLSLGLAPMIYHFPWKNSFSKYSVVSLPDLNTETSFKAKDVFLLGRFSKRILVSWSKTEKDAETVLHLHMQAAANIALWVLASLKQSVSLSEFIIRCLHISYEGDVRVEAKDKTQKLFQAEKEYYIYLYSSFLKTLDQHEYVSFSKNTLSVSPLLTNPTPSSYNSLIQRSRLRAVLRWPKSMLTASKWLDYIILKIERTQDIKIDLTPHQKKHWYIYAWKYLFILMRKNALK